MNDVGKWNFIDDDARHDAIVAEAQVIADGQLAVAEENRRAAVEAAEAAAPSWQWVAFWLGLFALFCVEAIYKR